jgi:hypothetical protein
MNVNLEFKEQHQIHIHAPARSPLNNSHFTMINLAKPQLSGLGLDRKQDYSVPS